MKTLAAKAFFPVGVTVTGFVALCCLILYSSLRADLTEQAAYEAESIARTIARSARHAMLTSDRETLAAIISNVGGQQGVTTLRIVNANGLVAFSKEPGEIHQLPSRDSSCISCHDQKRAVAIIKKGPGFAQGQTGPLFNVTVPIINESECSSAQCHVHPSTQRTLGHLHVGLDRSPLERSLADMRTKMALFSLLVLILTVGGVAVLLNHSLFAPLRRLAQLTSTLSVRQIKHEFEGQKGEIALIARNFLRVAAEKNSGKDEKH